MRLFLDACSGQGRALLVLIAERPARLEPGGSLFTLIAEPRASKRLLGRAALTVIEQLRGFALELVSLDEVADAVALPAFLVALGAKLLFLAEAGGVEAIGGNAELNEVILDGRGAAIAENNVVFGGAAFVAAAFDGRLDLRIFAEEVRSPAESFALWCAAQLRPGSPGN